MNTSGERPISALSLFAGMAWCATISAMGIRSAAEHAQGSGTVTGPATQLALDTLPGTAPHSGTWRSPAISMVPFSSPPTNASSPTRAVSAVRRSSAACTS